MGTEFVPFQHPRGAPALDPGLILLYCGAALSHGLWDGLSCSQPKHLITAKISAGCAEGTPSAQGSGWPEGPRDKQGALRGEVAGRNNVLEVVFYIFLVS